jgi:hypothetical protein
MQVGTLEAEDVKIKCCFGKRVVIGAEQKIQFSAEPAIARPSKHLNTWQGA